MSEVPDCQINDWLIEDSPEFREALSDLSPKCWARYDLSAIRVGWELARLNTRATDAELAALTYAQAKEAVRLFESEYIGQDQVNLWAWAVNEARNGK